jgi:hypothetical protein
MFEVKKLVIVIGIFTLIGGISSVILIHKSKPKNVIKDRLNIMLPADSQVIHYDYDKSGDYFDAKISISNESINYIKKELDNFFGGLAQKDAVENLPNFINASPWWDLDIHNAEVEVYMRFVTGKSQLFKPVPKSRQVWAFISKESNNQYYLYISY